MFIRSERLFLRPGWPEDWKDLLGLIGDEQVVRNLAKAPWPYTAEDAHRFVSMPHEPRLPRFLITEPGAHGARIVGGVGLTSAGSDVELGYWVARAHWGLGFASEAARAVLGLARTLGHARIVASHYIDNPASGRVLRKLGFRDTGRVVERFSKGRGLACPAREYAVQLRESGDCDDDDSMNRRRAA